MDPNNLFYFTYAKGFRVGGANAPLPTYCSTGLMDLGYASGQAPATYKSDSTQSYEIGSKDNFANVLRVATSIYYIKVERHSAECVRLRQLRAAVHG